MADSSSPIDLAITGLGPAILIGSGGFADVYRARQTGLDRDVAVKVLRAPADDDVARMRFERECRAMGALSAHPNIVSVFDGGFTPDGRAYLVMEFCSGGSLYLRLRRDGVMSAVEAGDVGRKVGRALEVAHQAGVLHRDIKAANVLVTSYGEPALADFGIARIEGAQHTATGEVTTSFAHAAPEILEGRPATARSDVFSLGSTLFELVLGRPPHARPGDEAVVALIRRATTESIQDPAALGMPEPLAGVIRRACAFNPDDRYPTAGAMVADLEGRAWSVPAAATPAPATRSMGPGELLSPPPAAPGVATEAAAPSPGPGVAAVPVVAPPSDPAAHPSGDPFAESSATTSLDTGGGLPATGDRTPTWPPRSGAAERSGGGAPPARGSRRWLATAAAVLIVAAGGAAATRLIGAGDAGEDPTTSSDASMPSTAPPGVGTPSVVFAEAVDGPVRSGDSYTLDVDGAAPATTYRLLEDGSMVAEGPAPFSYTPAPGRHEIVLQTATDPPVRSSPVELYAVGDLPPAGYRVNLASVPAEPGNWPTALAKFDELVAAGHTDLVLLPSDWFPQLTPGFWNLFIPGFGDEQDLGEAYCRSFDLAVPDDCFASYFDPEGEG